MATRISQAELNAITMVALPHINDDVRRALSDLLGEVSRHRNKARKLGEYAAKLRVLVGVAATDECTRGYCGDTPGCIWYFEHSPRRWCGPCRARELLGTKP